MRTSTRGKIELACHEGLSLQVYFDVVGVKTIGIGATVSEIPRIDEWPLTNSITVEEAFDLFERSLVKYENAVNKVLKAEVTQQEFDSLVSLAYNIGCSGIQKSTLIRQINLGADMATIRAAFLMWNIPKAIMGRRLKEALLFTTGEYQTSGKAQLYNTNGTGRINYKLSKIINLFDYIKA